MTQKENQTAKSPTQEIITAFGGLRPLAKALDVAVSRVQGWKERDSIPSAHHEEILQAAIKQQIILDVARVRSSDENRSLSEKNTKAGKENTMKGESDPKYETPKEAKKAPKADREEGKEKATAAFSAIPRSFGKVTEKPSPTAQEEKARETEDKMRANVSRPESKTGQSKAEAPKTGTSQPAARKEGAPRTASNRGSGGALRSFTTGVALTVLLLVGVAYTRGHWLPIVEGLPMLSSGQQPVSLKDLNRRLRDLEDLVYGAGQAGTEADIASIKRELEALRGDYRLLEQALRQAHSGGTNLDSAASGRGVSRESDQKGETIARLESQVAALQEGMTALQDISGSASRNGLSENQVLALNDLYLAMAVLQLRDALDGSSPFLRELELLQKIAVDRPVVLQQLQPLTPLAERGLPSLTSLQTELPALLRDVIAAQKMDAAQGWTQKAWARISNFISIRKIGLKEGDSLGAILWRAEEAAEQSDLPVAVMELNKLQGAAKIPVEDWLHRAQKRLDAQEAGRNLLAIVADVTAQGPLQDDNAINNPETPANSAKGTAP